MPIETHQVYAAIASAIGHKRMASTQGCSVQHTYLLTRDPVELDAPVRTDLDRFLALLEVAATHPDGKSATVLAELACNEFFDRINRRQTPKALTPETVCLETQEAIAQFGELLRECKPGFIPDKIAAEAADVIAVLKRFVAAAEKADDVPQIGRRVRPA